MKFAATVLAITIACAAVSTEAGHRRVAATLATVSEVGRTGQPRNAQAVRVKDRRYAGDCSARLYSHQPDCSPAVEFKAPDCAHVARAVQIVSDCGKVEATRYVFESDCGRPAGSVEIKGRTVNYDRK